MIQSNFVLLYIMILRNVIPMFKKGHDVCVCVENVPHYRDNGDFQNRVLLYNDVNDREDRNATG